MSGAITGKLIKPHDCAFLTPLPLYEDEFNADMMSGREKFISCFNVWQRYNFEVGALLRHVTKELSDAGIAVHTRATLPAFARLLESDSPVAIMLMAHWNKRGIEFVDDIVDDEWILAHLSVNQKKIIDLAVCHPEPVMQAIKNLRPNCIAHGPTRHISASPDIWLRYFSLVVHTLKNTSSTYIDASEMAFKGLLTLLP